MAVPDAILEKPGPLTKNERLTMLRQPYHTYHLLQSFGPSADDICHWAACHHEKLDGSGYPFGLTSAELDEGARILAVADITQALTERRPYREPLAWNRVRSILQNHAENRSLDRQIVDVVNTHVQDIIA